MVQRKNEIFVHLGLPKTASTFLQVIAFPQLEGIQYFRKRKFKHFAELAKNSTERKLLFTTESDRGFDKKLNWVIENFPDAKIILVFRRQDKWITSKYKYYIRKHGHLNFDEFFNLEKDNGFWKKEELYFMKYIEMVKEITSNQPLVLTFEELKKDHRKFIDRIAQFLRINSPSKKVENKIIKKAFSEKQLLVLRKFNDFYRYKELKTSSRFLNKVHYKYREFLLHIVAFLANFIPTSFIKRKALIPKEALKRIDFFYRNDWEQVMTYVNTPSPSPS